MTERETLTAEDHQNVYGDRVVARLLRMYDDHVAALAEMTVFSGTQTDECARLRAENERLRAELSAKEMLVQSLDGARFAAEPHLAAETRAYAMACNRADLAAARADLAEAEIEQVRDTAARADGRTQLYCASAAAAASRLATATALLSSRPPNRHDGEVWSVWDTSVQTFLANQPAAPECNYVGRCNSSRCPVHGQPAAPTYATAAQSTSELMARVHAAPTYATAAQSTSELMARVHAAPARTEAEQSTSELMARVHAAPARTEAEQAVLAEVGAVLETYEVSNKFAPPMAKALERLRAAELARRGAALNADQ